MFDAALGARAPIFYTSNGLIDPYAYCQIVTKTTYKLYPQCVDIVRLGFEQLQTPTNYINKVNLCTELSTNKEDGLHELEAVLYEIWANSAMSNHQPSVSQILSSCNAMINASINMTDGLLAISALLQPFWDENNQCLNLSEQVPAGKNGKIHCGDLTGCGDGLGGQQNIESVAGGGVASSKYQNFCGIDMFAPNWDWNMTWIAEHCHKRFILDEESIYNRQYWMKVHLGYLVIIYWNNNFEYTTSNTIFSNDMQDGWSAGAPLTHFTNSDTLVAILMANGAYHSDLKHERDLDTDDVTQASEMEFDYSQNGLKMLEKQSIE